MDRHVCRVKYLYKTLKQITSSINNKTISNRQPTTSNPIHNLPQSQAQFSTLPSKMCEWATTANLCSQWDPTRRAVCNNVISSNRRRLKSCKAFAAATEGELEWGQKHPSWGKDWIPEQHCEKGEVWGEKRRRTERQATTDCCASCMKRLTEAHKRGECPQ